jgi:hypothetical protein
VNLNRRLIPGIGPLGLLFLAGCSAPCQDSLGVYPPDHIVVTGVESVKIPYIAWECPGYNSDSIDPPPSVAPDSERQLRVDVTLEEGSIVEVRVGDDPAPINPGPAAGANSWVFQIPDLAEPLRVRVCSADDRCALYWANTYPDQQE